ncbi:MAG: PTS sugar transporter subunit IIA [Bacillota bacterium]
MLSNRCCNILLMLLKSKSSLKLKDIGNEFGISERATRYDLDSIDDFLLKYNFEVLTRKTNVGVGYNVLGENRKKLFTAILTEREGTVYDTPASRLMAILVNLILAKSHITIDGEADRLMVSRSTVFKDFEKLRTLFNKDGDSLFSSVSGYLLQGEEIYLRLLASKVVLSVIEARDIVEIIVYSNDEDSLLAGSKLYKLFKEVPEEGLRQSLAEIVKFKKGNLRDNTFAFCAVALCVAYARQDREVDGDIDYSKYTFTKEEVHEIASPLFGDDKNSHMFVCELLDYIEELEASGDYRQTFPEIQLYAYNLINKVSRLYGIDLLSARLTTVVAEELIDLIFDDLRGKDKLAPSLDMDVDIMLYEVLKVELSIYHNILKRNINDNDIARFFRIFYSEYLTFGFSAKRKKVIVLCPFDRVYSGLVAEKIKSTFDVDVIESWGLKALETDIQKYGCDLIVSTLQIAVGEITSMKIGTNFGDAGLARLKEHLPTRVMSSNVLKVIKGILANNEIEEDKAKAILKDISAELNISLEEVVSVNIDGKIMAVSICEAEDYIDALAKAGELMVDNGIVEPEYVAEMTKELTESKTHMVVMDSVVLAHSRKEEYVKKTGGVLVKLKNKVPFIDDDDEKCDLVFAMASKGVDSHFQMLAGISDIISDEEKIKLIKESSDEMEIYSLFLN